MNAWIAGEKEASERARNNAPGAGTFWEFTAGVNYYVTPDSHAIKVTAELEYFLTKFDSSSAPSNTLTGLLGPSDGDSQFLVGAQLQMVF